MDKRNLTDRYADLRIEKELSQTELAAALGVSKQIISAYENGDRPLSLDNLLKYADFFGVSADYLLGRTDIKTPKINVQKICDYTGLSENTVERLHGYSSGLWKESNDYAKVIDLLVNDGDIPKKDGPRKQSIMELLWEYFFAEYELLPVYFDKICETAGEEKNLMEMESEQVIFLRFKGQEAVVMRHVSELKNNLLPEIQRNFMRLLDEINEK